MKKTIVIGSISIDNVVYTKELPGPGTTVFGEAFLSNIGGKGANQACAAKFLGTDVFFYGSIGKDDNGKRIKTFFTEQGLSFKLKESDKSTGIASITLDMTTGENRIVIVPGSNMDINKQDILSLEEEISQRDIFLTQLENPVETVLEALKLAKKHNLITVLNPAPYHKVPDEIYQYIDYFVPNEHEIDGYVKNTNESFEDKAKEVLKKGCKNVIITLGENGSLLVNEKEVVKIDPIKVNAVDTTSAGDSYLGALVTALAENKNIVEAMQFATRCSAITVTRKGAIISLPKREEIR